MSEKMQMHPDQELQNNQNEFIDEHKRGMKQNSAEGGRYYANTMDDTSGTKHQSRKTGCNSHKLTHQQNSMYDHNSQDNNYQGRNYKKHSAGSYNNNSGSM